MKVIRTIACTGFKQQKQGSFPFFNYYEKLQQKEITISVLRGRDYLQGMKAQVIYQKENRMRTLIALIILLATASCNNLKFEASAICPPDLYNAINNPKPAVNSGYYDFINLIDVINNSTSALPVLRQIATFTESHMVNMLAMAQVYYQAQVDYNNLDQATKDQCKVGMTLQDCQNTCVDTPVFAQTEPTAKPGAINCPDTDPICRHMKDIGNYDEHRCLASFRSYVWRLAPEKSPLVMPTILFNAFAGSKICPNFNMLGFVSKQCMDIYNSNLNNAEFTSTLPMYKTKDLKKSLMSQDLLVQMQSVYTLAHSKFGHDLGRISMDCKVFIKTGPVAQEELDEYYASKADATTTDIAP